METMQPASEIELPRAAQRYWLVALGISLGGILVLSIFDGLTRLGVPSLADVAPGLQVPTGRTLIERTAFLTWQATALLLVGLVAGLAAVSGRTLWSVYRERTGIGWGVLVTLCAVGWAVLIAAGPMLKPGETTLLRGIEIYLKQSGNRAWAESGLGWVTFLPMRLAVAASMLVGTGMLALLLQRAKVSRTCLDERMDRLRLLLYVSALTLAVGVLATRSGYLWIFSFFVGDPESGFAEQARGLVQAASLRAGVLYSLYLGLFYLPTLWFLERQAEGLPRAATAVGRGGEKAGVGAPAASGHTWVEVLVQFAALVAPALTGAAGSLMGIKLG